MIRANFDIIYGALEVTLMVFGIKKSGKIRTTIRRITPWEAHVITVSPGTVAYPISKGKFLIEKWD